MASEYIIGEKSDRDSGLRRFLGLINAFGVPLLLAAFLALLRMFFQMNENINDLGTAAARLTNQIVTDGAMLQELKEQNMMAESTRRQTYSLLMKTYDQNVRLESEVQLHDQFMRDHARLKSSDDPPSEPHRHKGG